MKPLSKRFPEALKRIRELKGHDTQASAAKQCGLLQSTWNGIENGRSLPSLETLETIATKLGVPIHQFFNEEPEVIYTEAPEHDVRECFERVSETFHRGLRD